MYGQSVCHVRQHHEHDKNTCSIRNTTGLQRDPSAASISQDDNFSPKLCRRRSGTPTKTHFLIWQTLNDNKFGCNCLLGGETTVTPNCPKSSIYTFIKRTEQNAPHTQIAYICVHAAQRSGLHTRLHATGSFASSWWHRRPYSVVRYIWGFLLCLRPRQAQKR